MGTNEEMRTEYDFSGGTRGKFYDNSFSSYLPILIDIRSLHLTEKQFLQLCSDNRELRIELTAQGQLSVMYCTDALTGHRNAKLTYQIGNWAQADGTGITFSSSTLFTLPNGAKRSPDASWIKSERFEKLTEEEKEGFAPICPNFVVELRSKTDALPTLQNKMIEYLENGAQLGWLIDPKSKSVYIYRPGRDVECLEDPETVSGDPILSGFVLQVREIW